MPKADIDRDQFVAMKIAEAWEAWQEMLPDFDVDMDHCPISWPVCARATEKVALALWARQQRRDKKRPDRVALEDLLEEPADPRDHVRELMVSDLTSAMLKVLTDHQRRVLKASEGSTYRQISEDMGVSETAVKRALERARQILAGRFHEDLGIRSSVSRTTELPGVMPGQM